MRTYASSAPARTTTASLPRLLSGTENLHTQTHTLTLSLSLTHTHTHTHTPGASEGAAAGAAAAAASASAAAAAAAAAPPRHNLPYMNASFDMYASCVYTSHTHTHVCR